jgi:ribosomal protein L29
VRRTIAQIRTLQNQRLSAATANDKD